MLKLFDKYAEDEKKEFEVPIPLYLEKKVKSIFANLWHDEFRDLPTNPKKTTLRLTTHRGRDNRVIQETEGTEAVRAGGGLEAEISG